MGDPKQAIFGFRGADIFAYLAAGRDAEARRTLDRNWRSAPGLVRAVNAVFGRAGDPFLFDEISFHPVRPAEKERQPLVVAGDDEAPLRFWCLTRAGEREPMPKEKASPAAIQATAAEIARLLAAAGRDEARIGATALTGGDIAVLVRTNAQADRVREALLARGVASVQLGEASVFASHEAAEIERVLLAVAQPGREPLVRAALATDLFGLGGNALEVLDEDEAAWEARANAFLDYQALWRDQGFVQMFRRLMRAEGVAARLLRYEDGERRLTNVLHLTELLQAAAGADHLGMEGLIDWLAAHRQNGETAPEEAQLRLESDENLVKIATIHKSKGLQYPVVFCPFLWDVSLRGKDEGVGVLFHDPAAENTPTLDAGSDRFDEARARRRARGAGRASAARVRCHDASRASLHDRVGEHQRGGAVGAGLPAASAGGAGAGADRAAAVRARARGLRRPGGPGRSLAVGRSRRGRDRGRGASPRRSRSRPVPLGTRPESLQARPFAGRIAKGWQVTSFSGLTAGSHREAPDYDAAPSAERGGRTVLPGQPPGRYRRLPARRPGGNLHARPLRLAGFRAGRPGRASRRPPAKRSGSTASMSAWQAAVADTAEKVLRTPLDAATGLCLARVERVRAAGRADIPLSGGPPRSGTADRPAAHTRPRRTHPRANPGTGFDPVRGYMTGSMDLVFEAGGRYYLADYKSNWLGAGPDAYRAEWLPQVMARETYDLQYLIYTVALTRYLSPAAAGVPVRAGLRRRVLPVRAGDGSGTRRGLRGLSRPALRGVDRRRWIGTWPQAAEKGPSAALATLAALAAAYLQYASLGLRRAALHLDLF